MFFLTRESPPLHGSRAANYLKENCGQSKYQHFNDTVGRDTIYWGSLGTVKIECNVPNPIPPKFPKLLHE